MLVSARRRMRPASRCREAAGAILCGVGVIAAVLFGVSWDNTAHGRHEDDADAVATAVFLSMPAAGLATIWLWRARTAPTAKRGERAVFDGMADVRRGVSNPV